MNGERRDVPDASVVENPISGQETDFLLQCQARYETPWRVSGRMLMQERRRRSVRSRGSGADCGETDENVSGRIGADGTPSSTIG